MQPTTRSIHTWARSKVAMGASPTSLQDAGPIEYRTLIVVRTGVGLLATTAGSMGTLTRASSQTPADLADRPREALPDFATVAD
jgi:hypothetical protein